MDDNHLNMILGRPCNSYQEALRELRHLLPDRCKLYAQHAVNPEFWDSYKSVESQKHFVKYMHECNAHRIGELILDEKPDAFTHEHAMSGDTFKAELIVFSRAEWAKYESDLTNLLTRVRVVDVV